MSKKGHLEELRRKHEALSEKIEREQRSPGSNDLDVAGMKKQKLMIKEEIEKLATEA